MRAFSLSSVFAAVALAFAGCATVPLTPPLTESERQTVIADTAALLAEQFAPASTPLRFAQSAKPTKPLALDDDLAVALREKGFAIGEARDAALCSLTIVPVESAAVLLRVSIGDEWGAVRLYNRDPATGLSPDSAFNVRSNKDSIHE